MESHLVWYVPCVLSLVIHLSLAAPGLPGTQRAESEDAHPPKIALPNPFGSGEEERKLLQNYIQSTLKNDQGRPEISSREQEVFFLFRLYDFDRSGYLDGLEMMKLLSDYNSHHASGAEAGDLVVSMVDFLLQTQDLNQDGLLNPSELLSPAYIHTEEQEVAVEHTKEEAHQEIQPQEENILQQEVETGQDKAIQKTNEHEIAEAVAEGQGQLHEVPVHQGQPEI
ncbi:cell growth regulator with EF hand domain protein 1 [Cololabis saira]|uniref:cell growth regulator with EF hand domain protein 1 n=1 Tax=Cololabis saira TaxID=129043 RepID=UPI002AD378B5|nr:cell growth regulator with EF hand domain protein 1 [Cololabis saira]XP_061601370.1 cell growth regulator with EF hand domain protein 1 [Cololabis saira]